MESRHLDNKPLGRLFDAIGYVIFVAGLLCALMGAYVGREELARKLDKSVLQLWPVALVIIGFVLFFIAKMSRIQGGKLVSFGAKGMSNKHSLMYFFGYVLMAVGYGMTFIWIRT